MFRTLVLLALPLLAVGVVPGQTESKALRAFKKAFQSSAKSPKSPADRRAAVALLGEHDSKNVAKTLIAAYDEIEDQVVALDRTRLANMDERKALRAKIRKNGNRGSKQDLQRMNELRRAFPANRDRVDDLRELQFVLQGRLDKLRRADSLTYALKSVIGKKKYSVGMQLLIARAAGMVGAEMLEPLRAALRKAKKVAPKIALLDGIGLLGAAGKPAADDLVKITQGKDKEVAERAALALAQMKIPEAIAPLIDLMLVSEGARKRRLGGSLEILTGQQFGAKASTWQNWWAKEKGKYLAGNMPLGAGKVSAHEKFNRDNYYFGIPQEGKSILYIIDSSGSMKAPVKLKLKGTQAANAAKTETRLAACKKELIRALGRLEAKTSFNVLWYSVLPHLYKKTMSKAQKPAVKHAQDWVRKLKPNGSTNIHDSLQMAFQHVGRGTKDKAYGVAVDTIFLLTDGTPTRPNGKLDSTEKIIKAVREWNPLKRVTIHVIGIGNGLNVKFLSQLARENGGEFKRY